MAGCGLLTKALNSPIRGPWSHFAFWAFRYFSPLHSSLLLLYFLIKYLLQWNLRPGITLHVMTQVCDLVNSVPERKEPPVCVHLYVFMHVRAWGWHQWHQEWFWIALHWARLSQSAPGLASIAGLASQLVLGTPSPGCEVGISCGCPCPIGIYVDPGNYTLFLSMLPLCFGGHIPGSALAFWLLHCFLDLDFLSLNSYCFLRRGFSQ